MFGIDWLGILNASMGMSALGLLDPVDISSLSEKEVDTVAPSSRRRRRKATSAPCGRPMANS